MDFTDQRYWRWACAMVAGSARLHMREDANEGVGASHFAQHPQPRTAARTPSEVVVEHTLEPGPATHRRLESIDRGFAMLGAGLTTLRRYDCLPMPRIGR